MRHLQSIPFTRLALFNFIVLSLWGVVLRYMQLAGLPFNYQYLLHAHSHFAFSGWMFLAIAFLIARHCSNGKLSTEFCWVLILAQVSAWGMLLSFSLQGYRAVSITFSTLFVLVGFRLAYLVWKSKGLHTAVNTPARLMISYSLIFLCLSALGPFALGPLAARGMKAQSVYQDAIYFYLHFQLNGFMELAVLGLLARRLSIGMVTTDDKRWLHIFTLSVMPLYLIFCLWSHPASPVWWIAGTGASLHLLSWLVLATRYRDCWLQLSWPERLALVALTLKCLLQLVVCFPLIGEWTFLNRNLIIGYIHLLTLGIVMPLLIGQFIRGGYLRQNASTARLLGVYMLLVVLYLFLLFLQPLLGLVGIIIPFYQLSLFIISVLFFCWGISIWIKTAASL
ncbi:hypothetical protein [Mucilaginibacter boryungensis]|uniref:NnrS protein n=1 Tax=Mucilaginibacter boryungensis TaxID=768480 RepID=A0ABR9XE42_9SPHI|nr:hypothetical protein [Mucilaginibacter boryungensis]MBE9665349.1 hypothetical protein [Mucilaginibacter boryungensis]